MKENNDYCNDHEQKEVLKAIRGLYEELRKPNPEQRHINGAEQFLLTYVIECKRTKNYDQIAYLLLGLIKRWEAG